VGSDENSDLPSILFLLPCCRLPRQCCSQQYLDSCGWQGSCFHHSLQYFQGFWISDVLSHCSLLKAARLKEPGRVPVHPCILPPSLLWGGPLTLEGMAAIGNVLTSPYFLWNRPHVVRFSHSFLRTVLPWLFTATAVVAPTPTLGLPGSEYIPQFGPLEGVPLVCFGSTLGGGALQ
jgi:hypothetical protein